MKTLLKYISLLFVLTILLTACASPIQESVTITPTFYYTDQDSGETIYWSFSEVESIPWKSDEYYTLKAYYTESEGRLVYHQETKKIFFQDLKYNEKEFYLK